jgi:hypothetical protein
MVCQQRTCSRSLKRSRSQWWGRGDDAHLSGRHAGPGKSWPQATEWRNEAEYCSGGRHGPGCELPSGDDEQSQRVGDGLQPGPCAHRTAGPSPFHSPSVNVTCKLEQWDDAYWYRLLNPNGWSFPASSAYVSADETHELNPGMPYPIPECANVGCRRRAGRAAGFGVLATAAVLAWCRGDVALLRRAADRPGSAAIGFLTSCYV